MPLTKATYSMINGASVNVLDFGAVGDGVTDNTAAIAAAIAAAAANYAFGGSVYFPAGTYLADYIEMVAEITLQGDGMRASFVKRRASSTTGHFVRFKNGSTNAIRVIIRDMAFDGSSCGTDLDVINFASNTTGTVEFGYGFLENVIVTYGTGYGVNIFFNVATMQNVWAEHNKRGFIIDGVKCDAFGLYANQSDLEGFVIAAPSVSVRGLEVEQDVGSYSAGVNCISILAAENRITLSDVYSRVADTVQRDAIIGIGANNDCVNLINVQKFGAVYPTYSIYDPLNSGRQLTDTAVSYFNTGRGYFNNVTTNTIASSVSTATLPQNTVVNLLVLSGEKTGLFLIYANGNNANFFALAYVGIAGTNPALSVLASNGIALTLSGATVQAEQVSVASVGVQYTYLGIGP
jgi:hypothetical protein